MRSIGLALLAAALLATALQPHLAARASTLRTVGCAAMGYTLQVPSDATVRGDCTATMVVAGAGMKYGIGVRVERHGFWNDQRSRSSITNDLAALATSLHGQEIASPYFRANTQDGHRYYMGTTELRVAGSLDLAMEQETFYQGRMFKFVAVVAASANGAQFVGMLWSTIRLIDSGPQPDMQLAFEMASLEYGYVPARDDPMVGRFARDLVALQTECRQSQQTVGDEVTKAWDLDKQNGGRTDLISMADALVTSMKGDMIDAGTTCVQMLALLIGADMAH